MDELTNTIHLHYADEDINNQIKDLPDKEGVYTKHFTYNENFFIMFKEDFIVPHIPIHHDIRHLNPGEKYLSSIKTLFKRLFLLSPEIFSGLIYFFNPGEILRPAFFKLYKIKKNEFIYILRLDLLFNTQYAHIEERGDNDVTPEYRTNVLFLQSHLLPLQSVTLKDGKIESMKIKQTISETWIGEQGRGYLVKGIWIDDELTKFFTKIFLPKGKKIYPYYPFLCMYKTLCANIINPGKNERELMLPYFYSVIKFLSPYMRKIEKGLKNNKFSEDLELFKEIKSLVPSGWDTVFKNIRTEAYLNQNDLKEYRIVQDR